jgi:Flp pilus assembly protein TadB
VNGRFLDRSAPRPDIAQVEGVLMPQFDRLAALGPDARSNARKGGRGLLGPLAAFVGLIAAACAMAVGAVLAVFAAAAMAVMALIGGLVLALATFALRARRSFGRPARRASDPEVIEAHKVDGTWVAYGWERR